MTLAVQGVRLLPPFSRALSEKILCTLTLGEKIFFELILAFVKRTKLDDVNMVTDSFYACMMTELLDMTLPGVGWL